MDSHQQRSPYWQQPSAQAPAEEPRWGIYSVLLSIGAIVGSLLAAGLGRRFLVDGLIYGTFALALIALAALRILKVDEHSEAP